MNPIASIWINVLVDEAGMRLMVNIAPSAVRTPARIRLRMPAVFELSPFWLSG